MSGRGKKKHDWFRFLRRHVALWVALSLAIGSLGWYTLKWRRDLAVEMDVMAMAVSFIAPKGARQLLGPIPVTAAVFSGGSEISLNAGSIQTESSDATAIDGGTVRCADVEEIRAGEGALIVQHAGPRPASSDTDVANPVLLESDSSSPAAVQVSSRLGMEGELSLVQEIATSVKINGEGCELRVAGGPPKPITELTFTPSGSNPISSLAFVTDGARSGMSMTLADSGPSLIDELSVRGLRFSRADRSMEGVESTLVSAKIAVTGLDAVVPVLAGDHILIGEQDEMTIRTLRPGRPASDDTATALHVQIHGRLSTLARISAGEKQDIIPGFTRGFVQWLADSELWAGLVVALAIEIIKIWFLEPAAKSVGNHHA